MTPSTSTPDASPASASAPPTPSLEVVLTGLHLDIDPAVRELAQTKLDKLPRYYDRVSKVEVTLSPYDRHACQAELIAHVDGHEHFVAKAQHDEPAACIELAVDKLARQLHEYKEKRRNKKHAV